MAATFINLRINNAEQFRESLSEPAPNTKVYLTFGKTSSWANDAAPGSANTSMVSVYDVWSNMIGGKKLNTSDLSHVIRRFDYTANTNYRAYSDRSTNLFSEDAPFYVMTDEFNVYKCIANNKGALSTVKPTSVNPALFTQTSDGYIWKFMYQVSSADKLRFLTDNYMPIKNLSSDDGSLQWQVQNNAVDGAINSILVLDGGSDYTNTSNMVITISGDGVQAQAIPTLNTTSNTVETIVITDGGQSYTYADVTISGGGGTGATAQAVISPPGGHGSDALYELGGKEIMISARLINTEEGTLPITNDFRQIALLRNPLVQNTNTVMSNTTFLQTYTITTSGTDDFLEDEILYQGEELETATFRGRVVSWDSANGTALLINTKGSASSGSITGNNSTITRFLVDYTPGNLEPHSGHILYLDYVEPISRSIDQTEDFKIIVRF